MEESEQEELDACDCIAGQRSIATGKGNFEPSSEEVLPTFSPNFFLWDRWQDVEDNVTNTKITA
jgi:hypothetical protein